MKSGRFCPSRGRLSPVHTASFWTEARVKGRSRLASEESYLPLFINNLGIHAEDPA